MFTICVENVWTRDKEDDKRATKMKRKMDKMVGRVEILGKKSKLQVFVEMLDW